MSHYSYSRGREIAMIVLTIAAVLPPHAHGVETTPLVCEQPQISIGDTHSVNQRHKFTFRNSSTSQLEITATHKACGCVKREFTKYRLAPGDTTELTLEFPIRTRPGGTGEFAERMEIYVNDQHELPAAVVSVAGCLVPIAYRLRDGIHIEAAPGRRDFKGRCDIFINKARGVRIDSVETHGPLELKARISNREEALKEGEERVVLEVTGTLPKDGVLPATATVLVKLNSDEMPEMSIPVTLYRKEARRVRFSPEMLAFGVVPFGAKVKRVVTVERPKDGKFAVEEAGSPAAGVTVVVEENVKVPHVVKLRCELDGSTSGKIERELLVTVRSPEGAPEVYKIPVSGFIKVGAASRPEQVQQLEPPGLPTTEQKEKQ